MYAMVNIGTDYTYKSSGYYVKLLDGEENQVGEIKKLPAVSVPIGATYAIRMTGEGLTAGTYKLTPYLVVANQNHYQYIGLDDDDGTTVYEIFGTPQKNFRNEKNNYNNRIIKRAHSVGP